MRRMTEEEADALDELVTKNPPRVDPSKARHAIRMVSLDDLSADYLYTLPATQAKVKAVIDRVAAGKPEIAKKWRLGPDMYDILEDIKNNPV